MQLIPRISRRAVASSLVAAPLALGLAKRAGGAASGMDASTAGTGDGLTRTSEAIHQEISFKASTRRVYDALTDARQFDAVTRLSDAIALLSAPGAKATAINPAVGGSFVLFGGYISGLTLEMLPGERLVQAWRTAGWKAGEYSTVQFTLAADGAGTKLIFDHRGFPDGDGNHLAGGWHVHYWTSLALFLSQA